jgi:hypothetical protein
MLRASTTKFLNQASVLNRSSRLFSSASIALVRRNFLNKKIRVYVPDFFLNVAKIPC